MELYVGRPLTNEGREEREIAVYDYLDNLGIEYYRVDHQSAGTMQDCQTVERVLDNVICKNLFLCNRQKTKFYLYVTPSDKPFVTREFSPKVNSSRLSFGTSQDLERLLNVHPGSVSIMGLIFDKENVVQLVIDKELLTHKDFSCHPCKNTSSLRLKRADVFGKFLDSVHHAPIFLSLRDE